MATRILGLLTILLVALPSQATPPAAPVKLELPPPQTVDYRPGKLLRVEAKGALKVAWDVVTVPKVELDFAANGNVLLLPVPPAGTVAWIIAAAAGPDGTPQLARTSVTVRGEAVAGAKPPAVKGGAVRHATIVYDSSLGDGAGLKALRGSATFAQACADRGVRVRSIDVRDAAPDVKALEFDRFYEAAGGPCLVLQDAEGNVIPGGQAFRLTLGADAAENEKALLSLIDQVNQK